MNPDLFHVFCLRLEVWSKGGGWNENPFYYFCFGESESSAELYFISQLSPGYVVKRSEEAVEIEPTLANIMRLVKGKFLTDEEKVYEEFKQCKVEIVDFITLSGVF